MRKYFEAIRSTQSRNKTSTCEEFERWSQRALAQADRIDPAIGGASLVAEQDEAEDTPRQDPHHGLSSFAEPMEGNKSRIRSESFADYFSQARQFFYSQTEPEQNHIVSAFIFELSKVETPAVGWGA